MMEPLTLRLRLEDNEQLADLTTQVRRLAAAIESLDTAIKEGHTDMSFLSEFMAGLRLVLDRLPPDDPYLTPKSAPSATRIGAEASRAAWLSKVSPAYDAAQDDAPSAIPSGYTDRLSHTASCISRWQLDTNFNTAYLYHHPNYCRFCDGWGRVACSHGAPHTKLSAVSTKVYDTCACPACVVAHSLCPRCGGKLKERYSGDHAFMALRCEHCNWEPAQGGLRCVHCTCGVAP